MEIQEWISKDQWCLYKHTSPSGKVYVGITNNTKSRWGGGKGYKTQFVFWRAIQKYGWENFIHEILETGLTLDEAKQKEVSLIKELDSTNPNFGYNMTKGGDYVPMCFHTEECIKKSLATKRAKLADGIHQANYGRKASPELRKKLSDAHRGLQVGPNHPMYGKHLTDEQKQHLREINTGKKHTEEEKRKISESGKGKHGGELHPWYGKHLPEETRKKISESLKNSNHPLHGLKGEAHPCYGRKQSPEAIEKSRLKRSKPVLQYSLDGELLNRYDGLTSAARAVGSNTGSISLCCRGRLKTAKKFIWRYESDPLPTHNPPVCNTPPSLSNK